MTTNKVSDKEYSTQELLNILEQLRSDGEFYTTKRRLQRRYKKNAKKVALNTLGSDIGLYGLKKDIESAESNMIAAHYETNAEICSELDALTPIKSSDNQKIVFPFLIDTEKIEPWADEMINEPGSDWTPNNDIIIDLTLAYHQEKESEPFNSSFSESKTLSLIHNKSYYHAFLALRSVETNNNLNKQVKYQILKELHTIIRSILEQSTKQFESKTFNGENSSLQLISLSMVSHMCTTNPNMLKKIVDLIEKLGSNEDNRLIAIHTFLMNGVIWKSTEKEEISNNLLTTKRPIDLPEVRKIIMSDKFLSLAANEQDELMKTILNVNELELQDLSDKFLAQPKTITEQPLPIVFKEEPKIEPWITALSDHENSDELTNQVKQIKSDSIKANTKKLLCNPLVLEHESKLELQKELITGAMQMKTPKAMTQVMHYIDTAKFKVSSDKLAKLLECGPAGANGIITLIRTVTPLPKSTIVKTAADTMNAYVNNNKHKLERIRG